MNRQPFLFMDPKTSVLQALTSQFGNSLCDRTVLAAVSGGVDSIVLVHILWELQPVLGYALSAVTVDHNMRTDGSSRCDALFTDSFCRQCDIPCTIVEIPEGRLFEKAEERNGGIEDAARCLRYEIFEDLAVKTNAAAVFLAHNRNDQLETVLERFLQGSDSIGARGMPSYRHPFFRPLLSVSRSEIEAYAVVHGLSWRTDPTNSDTAYLRNRIRHTLIPLLNSEFPGWDTAVLKGAVKSALEAESLQKYAACCSWTVSDSSCVCTELSAFLVQPLAVRIRILYNGLQLLPSDERIPYVAIAEFAEKLEPVTLSGISFSVSSGVLKLSQFPEHQTALRKNSISGFSCVISGEGEYDIPQGRITVHKKGICWYACHEKSGAVSGLFNLPAVIRSCSSSDVIRTKDNGKKGVVKILSEWKVPVDIKYEIPVIEDTEVRGIWGGPAGFDDWFVLQGVIS